MSKSTTILIFFKRKNLNNFEVIADDDYQPLALMSQFLKISKQKFQMSPLTKVQVLYVILKCVSKYGNMMLMNGMKFKELTLSLVHTNLNQMSTTKFGRHYHKFKPSWFAIEEFSPWLEYSPSKDVAFCLPCFLFDKPTRNSGSHVFTKDGFRNQKKVNDGNNETFFFF